MAKLLVHPDRIQNAQHRRRRRERDAAGRPSDGSVYDRGRGDGERAGVVFADPEHVQAVLLSEP
jgi:hypothetical protein